MSRPQGGIGQIMAKNQRPQAVNSNAGARDKYQTWLSSEANMKQKQDWEGTSNLK
jgi:hypothetical protein